MSVRAFYALHCAAARRRASGTSFDSCPRAGPVMHRHTVPSARPPVTVYQGQVSRTCFVLRAGLMPTFVVFTAAVNGILHCAHSSHGSHRACQAITHTQSIRAIHCRTPLRMLEFAACCFIQLHKPGTRCACKSFDCHASTSATPALVQLNPFSSGTHLARSCGGSHVLSDSMICARLYLQGANASWST